MFDKSKIVVRYATPEDVEGICTLENTLILSNRPPKKLATASREGFLIHRVDSGEFSEYLRNTDQHILLAAKDAYEIVGYLLAHDFNIWEQQNPNWSKNLNIPDEKLKFYRNQKTLYLQHIARNKINQGIATQLFAQLLEIAVLKGFTRIVCEILADPIPNQVSLEFHLKQGFEIVGQDLEKGGLVWTVLEKNI